MKELTPRTKELIEDMLDTMYEANGVGLAAPQVGILKRIVVIDVGEGPVVMVNPVILETSGEQTGDEGCLSIPGKAGQVTRPNYVKVHAFDENMEEYEIEGTELMARAMCHEIDHLDGHLYVEKWKASFMTLPMRKRNRRRGKKQKRNRKRGEDHESYIYGNPGFCSGYIRGNYKSRT